MCMRALTCANVNHIAVTNHLSQNVTRVFGGKSVHIGTGDRYREFSVCRITGPTGDGPGVHRFEKGTPVVSLRQKKPSRWIACAAVLTLGVLTGPTASANPGDPPIPSKQAVASAQQRFLDAQNSVSGIESQLTAADEELQGLGVAADKASEAYDGAVYEWQQDQQAATAARHRAARATAQAANARARLAGYAVSHSTAGSAVSALSSAMSATGTTSLINSLAVTDQASAALASRFETWQAQSRLARVYRTQAVSALSAATAAKAAAGAAKQAAADAVAQQQSAVASITAQKSALVDALAAAQHTSVRLAADRAAGLERRREERLAAERAAALKAKREAERQARLAAERQEQRREERQREQQNPPGDPGQGNSGSTGSGSTGSSGSGTGTPPQNPPPGGAQAAISFAYAQLGDPYVYGAAGPDAWDCSGLTMGAWAAAGVSLPHYSVAQYADIEHISFDQLQPGDLVFWGSSSDPTSIYHVALYIGNDEIIQAPHPGAYVEVSSLYDWILPNFFGRV